MKILTTTALILSLGAGAALAEETAMADPTVSFADALKIVEGASTGHVVAMELDAAFDGPAYIAEIEGEQAQTTLVVDALSGEILAEASVKVARPELLDEALLALSGGADLPEDGLCPGDEVPIEMVLMMADLDEEAQAELIAEMMPEHCDTDLDTGEDAPEDAGLDDAAGADTLSGN